jgi:hypothetical protein
MYPSGFSVFADNSSWRTPMTDTDQEAREIQYINLKLGRAGATHLFGGVSGDLLEVAWPLLAKPSGKKPAFGRPLCPADRRIQNFLDAYFVKRRGWPPFLFRT